MVSPEVAEFYDVGIDIHAARASNLVQLDALQGIWIRSDPQIL